MVLSAFVGFFGILITAHAVEMILLEGCSLMPFRLMTFYLKLEAEKTFFLTQINKNREYICLDGQYLCIARCLPSRVRHITLNGPFNYMKFLVLNC